MSDTEAFTVVYRYHYWDEEQRQLVVSKWEATLECIRQGLGIPIVESGRKVPLAALDDHGRLIVAAPAHAPQPAPAPGRAGS